jgi:3-deoxy-D-manno-octulosonic-acid transferase
VERHQPNASRRLKARCGRAHEDAREDRIPEWAFWVYNLLLLLASLLVSPYFAYKTITVEKHRTGFFQRLGFYPRAGRMKNDRARSVWIHAVSIGELLATLPLFRRIKETHGQLPVAVSSVTRTAMAVARERLRDADLIVYLPFDYPLPIRSALRRIRPKLLVHTESEIWPNLLFMLGRRGIPSAIVNGRMSERSCRWYGRFRFFYSWMLRSVSVFGMQSRSDCLRMIRIGADPRRVYLTGNMKFDIPGPPDSAAGRNDLRKDLCFDERTPVFVAGSTHEGEESILLDAFARLRKDYPALKMLLAPRHPERCGAVERLAETRGVSTVRRTRSRDRAGSLAEEVLLLDTIGELFRAYSIAEVVFLGGSLVPIGGHNILEPVWFRKPVLIGPYTDKIEAVVRDLRKVRGAIVVRDDQDLADEIHSLLRDPASREKAGEAAFGVLRNYQGATERNLALLQPFLDDETRA